MISTLYQRFTDPNEKKPEVILTIIPNDIYVEIFRRLVSTFEEVNLYKLGQCHLTSKGVRVLTELIWREIRRETGMSFTFQVCNNTSCPEAYGWMLNKQVLVLIHKLFRTKAYPLPANLIKQIKQNRETLLQVTSFLLKKSPSLSNRFFTIASENDSQSVLSLLNKKLITAFSYIFPMKQTPDAGEQILQIFVDAKQSEKFELNLDSLKKIIVEHDPDVLPFMMKILLSLHRLCFPAMDLILKNGVELWKSGKKSYLEIMIIDLWKRKDEDWLLRFLEYVYNNPQNQIGLVTLLFAVIQTNHVYSKAIISYGPKSISDDFVKPFLGKIQITDFPERLTNSLITWTQNLAIIDSLEEKSVITELFFPFLFKLNPQSAIIMLLEVKQKIRLGCKEAERLFKNYLKVKYAIDDSWNMENGKISGDELEIFAFIHLGKKDLESIQRAYDSYMFLAKKHSKSIDIPLSQKLYIRYSLGLIEAEMNLGKFKEAKDRIRYIIENLYSEMSGEQIKKLHQLARMMNNLIQITKSDPVSPVYNHIHKPNLYSVLPVEVRVKIESYLKINEFIQFSCVAKITQTTVKDQFTIQDTRRKESINLMLRYFSNTDQLPHDAYLLKLNRSFDELMADAKSLFMADSHKISNFGLKFIPTYAAWKAVNLCKNLEGEQLRLQFNTLAIDCSRTIYSCLHEDSLGQLKWINLFFSKLYRFAFQTNNEETIRRLMYAINGTGRIIQWFPTECIDKLIPWTREYKGLVLVALNEWIKTCHDTVFNSKLSIPNDLELEHIEALIEGVKEINDPRRSIYLRQIVEKLPDDKVKIAFANCLIDFPKRGVVGETELIYQLSPLSSFIHAINRIQDRETFIDVLKEVLELKNENMKRLRLRILSWGVWKFKIAIVKNIFEKNNLIFENLKPLSDEEHNSLTEEFKYSLMELCEEEKLEEFVQEHKENSQGLRAIAQYYNYPFTNQNFISLGEHSEILLKHGYHVEDYLEISFEEWVGEEMISFYHPPI